MTSPRPLGHWTVQSRMSDLGRHASSIARLPDGVSNLNAVVQGLLLHSDWLAEYGVTSREGDASARRTLRVEDRLDDVFRQHQAPLYETRSTDKRSIGTCRDYALTLCSFLRAKGVPARVRCGFAAYFTREWEDHWVCEYWTAESEAWRLSDAQLDERVASKLGIAFDPADVPRHLFLTAGEAWTRCRREEIDASSLGHGDVTGPWFVKVNVLRDHLALNGRETSDWDRWREAPEEARVVSGHEIALLDDLSARPEQPLVDISPDWLERR